MRGVLGSGGLRLARARGFVTLGVRWRRADEGASSVEYALLAGFIAFVAAAGILVLGLVVLDLIGSGRDAVPK
jgi:Flp pilus assembly pilin Flp